MSNVPKEPGDAALVKPEQVWRSGQEYDAHFHAVNPASKPSNSRSASSSLLTRLFSSVGSPASEPFDTGTESTLLDVTQRTNLHASIDKEQQQCLDSDIISASPTTSLTSEPEHVNRAEWRSSMRHLPQLPQFYRTASLHDADSAMASTTQLSPSPYKFIDGPRRALSGLDAPDLNRVNNLLNGHRDFLNAHESRGHSLERTLKERRVQTLPPASIIANPGDTGLVTPVTPLTPQSHQSLATNPALDDLRAKYRSWRDARPGVVVHEKAAWSIGNEESMEHTEGQVEKSIADALAGIEPNARSRKASHSLRFFKEGLPDEKARKDKERGRSKDAIKVVDEQVGIESASISQCTADSNFRLPTTYEETDEKMLDREVLSSHMHKPSRSDPQLPESGSTRSSPSEKEGLQALPQQLLDDLRRNHNLLPTNQKGSSFSQSLRAHETAKDQLQDTSALSTRIAQFSGHTKHEDTPTEGVGQHSDEESGEEISSALFIPHQATAEPKQRDHRRSESEITELLQEDRDTDGLDNEPGQWLVEHPPLSRQGTDATRSSAMPKSDIPSPNLVHPVNGTVIRHPMTDIQIADARVPSDASTGYATSEDGYTTRDEFNESEDEEVTPQNTLRNGNHLSNMKEKSSHHRKVLKPPPASIELIPYKHQVGGHTIMWRFSDRAVCKKLNNRENEFYEKIEQNAPRLLKFMPKYAFGHRSPIVDIADI